ncbi:MAG: 50S ribosomal protein L15 [Candidatus Nealsonbacteria bacterium RIFCSPLOWO2_12_FULL_39_31]|uniref:Large ribosomal subunit protein uL15 n=3 Tax=Candidatus Nealsoniibacteriota TaxID=1817911 RepID=A0A1G2EI66_9BACT|nr:MAG: 50S ribosomal protein L15 [Parcubacteria group bacterium GW2011_GWA2_38_27]KKQ96731.1 MAG: 50S ribosomal protein L15 [Parcubacteria group bacterium GW2011_GWC2_39_11]OGZ19910.1 MAG: 50S ribosomal protein L15 [Candidatus Nealsonbacteria bacterium RIFCSPHIGHO2_01_FULL_38_55]OGZ21492.1 MAG: 50S ribosomal protein L15 [Candidatus Nealsonbacteria bacterium RIFCSPHIGHO2_02_FULL_38_75]OGZ22282.1 MAG: 50S ribosomal protein L15 [Candidatus Nealsonbacteria bacterium RIFCSPHIGHO2_02_38_10]OGZ23039
MQIHQLRPIHKPTRTMRIGRGGKRGTYSGKGIKGQTSRAGRNFEPLIRGLIKKYPKLRGYRAIRKMNDLAIVNIGVINKNFKPKEIVNPETLIAKKIIRRIGGKTAKVKILGGGEIKKSLNIRGCEVSESAKRKIEKAGGYVKQMDIN